MPWVLMGMGLALLIGVLAWTRAWTHRDRASLQAAQWQAELLAESATACAEDQVWNRLNGSKVSKPDTASKDTSKQPKAGLSASSSTDSASSPVDSCEVPMGIRGTMDATIEEGNLLVPVLANAEVPYGNRTLRRSIRVVLAGALDRNLFDEAISEWTETTPSLNTSGSKIVGKIKIKATGTPPSGKLAQPTNQIGVLAYIPMESVLDTATLGSRMKDAFRRDDAYQGSAHYGPGSPLPQAGEIVHTSFGKGSAEVDLDGSFGAGSNWKPAAKTLFVEGDIRVRGAVDLDGWTLIARGAISLERGARLRNALLYAERGVSLMDDATVQGQILSFRKFAMHDDSRLVGASTVICWGVDSAVALFDGHVRARAYVVAMGGSSKVFVDREALVEGVVVSQGTLRVDGTVHGVSVAGRFDCGRMAESCTGTGTFDRSKLPLDFAVPLGLPGSRGMRVASWESVGP